MSKIKVVTIGGGNGSAIALVALKQHLKIFDVAAVVSMCDSGGSSGQLREEFKVLPPGDILRAVLALSKYDYSLLKKIFHINRFKGAGKLNKHNLGNLFLVLAKEYGGDYLNAVRALEQAVEAMGHVYPASFKIADLCAQLTNGKVIKTEAAIDEPKYDRKLKIKKVWLEPKVRASAGAIKVIEAADYIFLAPGSVVTSVVATLLPEGICEAIRKSKGKLVYANGGAYAINGETGPETFSEAVRFVQSYLPRKIDMVIHNTHKHNELSRKKYNKRKWMKLKDDAENLSDYNVGNGLFEKDDGGLCALRLGEILIKNFKVCR